MELCGCLSWKKSKTKQNSRKGTRDRVLGLSGPNSALPIQPAGEGDRDGEADGSRMAAAPKLTRGLPGGPLVPPGQGQRPSAVSLQRTRPPTCTASQQPGLGRGGGRRPAELRDQSRGSRKRGLWASLQGLPPGSSRCPVHTRDSVQPLRQQEATGRNQTRDQFTPISPYPVPPHPFIYSKTERGAGDWGALCQASGRSVAPRCPEFPGPGTSHLSELLATLHDPALLPLAATPLSLQSLCIPSHQSPEQP